MKVAIASCLALPEGSEDDQLLVQQLIKLGFQVSTLPWQKILVQDFDVVIVRATWDYHLNLTKFKDWIRSFRGSDTILLNSSDVIEWNCDKIYLSEMQEESVNIVPSLFVTKEYVESELLSEIEQRAWKQLVVKPTISATAHLTFRCEASDLKVKLDQVLVHSSAVIQPYLPSVASDGEVSLIFFCGDKPEYVHAVLKTATANEFRVQSNFGGQVQSFSPSPELIQFAMNCVRVPIDDWTFARVDIVNYKTNPMLGELEMIEPNLFFEQHPMAAMRLAQIIKGKLS